MYTNANVANTKISYSTIIGRARPVWTDEAGDGDYVLMASLADFPIPNVTEGDAQ